MRYALKQADGRITNVRRSPYATVPDGYEQVSFLAYPSGYNSLTDVLRVDESGAVVIDAEAREAESAVEELIAEAHERLLFEQLDAIGKLPGRSGDSAAIERAKDTLTRAGGGPGRTREGRQ